MVTTGFRTTPRELLPVIFISYRISDANDVVARLDDSLTAEFWRPAVFRDKTRLQGGQDWTRKLEGAARSCDAMLVVIGARWKAASFEDGHLEGFPRLSDPEDWVRKEISLALAHDRLVIPILINGASMPTEAWLANVGLGDLHSKQGMSLRTDDYEPDLAALVRLLRSKCPSLPSATPKRAGLADPVAAAVDAPALERLYRASLQAEHDRPQGIFASQIPSMRRVFVDLGVELGERSPELRERLTAKRERKLRDLLTAERADGPQPRSVVLGDPGSGKSTMARHLVFKLASDPSGPIPVYASLPSLAAKQSHPFDLAENNLRPGADRALRRA